MLTGLQAFESSGACREAGFRSHDDHHDARQQKTDHNSSPYYSKKRDPTASFQQFSSLPSAMPHS
jgi:hypothetical protein